MEANQNEMRLAQEKQTEVEHVNCAVFVRWWQCV